jgi:hypothetical protein
MIMMIKHTKHKRNGILAGPAPIFFFFIAFGLTIISAYNGFKFYRVLFRFFLAALISSTFELARIACLFKYRNSKKKIGTLTFPLYIIIALVCAFTSINSFTAEVIIRDRTNEKEAQAQIYKIKTTYSESVTKRITEKKSLFETLQYNFGEDQVERLYTLSKKHFEKKGKLPPTSNLNLALRPIIKYLKNIDKKNLKELLKNEL